MNLAEMLAYQDFQSGRGAPSGTGGAADILINKIKQEQDAQRRQQNVKDQLKTYQDMMKEMSNMPDMSDAGKTNDFIGNDVKQRHAGIVGASTMIPTQKMTVGENGIKLELGFKSASPTDQKNLIDIEKTQGDMQREERKRSFRTAYITGQISEGAYIQEMGNLDLTPDEFQSDTSARTKYQTISAQGQGMPIPYSSNANSLSGYSGNIDLSNRPRIQNADGSFSTEKSFSVNLDGKEVLLPTIINGKEVSKEDAINHYYQTGENLGVFNTPEEADVMAEKIHNRFNQQSQGTLIPLTSGQGITGGRGMQGALGGVRQFDGMGPRVQIQDTPAQIAQPQEQGGTTQSANQIPEGYKPVYGLDELGNTVMKGIEPIKQSDTAKDIAAGQRMATQSFNIVSGSLNELSRTYADAFREGGIGSKAKEITGKARLWAGGSQAEQLAATSAFPGQKTEVISRMMPLLTQQGDKPGSVRLVQTVFDKLEKTLPDFNTPPKNARRMMEQTVRNMYRFSRAAQMMSDMGVTDENWDSFSNEQKKTFSQQLEALANNVQLDADEEEQLNDLVSAAVGPIDDLIGGNGEQQSPMQGNKIGRFIVEEE